MKLRGRPHGRPRGSSRRSIREDHPGSSSVQVNPQDHTGFANDTQEVRPPKRPRGRPRGSGRGSIRGDHLVSSLMPLASVLSWNRGCSCLRTRGSPLRDSGWWDSINLDGCMGMVNKEN